jgi:hypothetical protein
LRSFFDAGVRAKPALAQRKGFALSLDLSDRLSAIPPGIAGAEHTVLTRYSQLLKNKTKTFDL